MVRILFVLMVAVSVPTEDRQLELLVDRYDISSPATPRCHDCGQSGHVDCNGDLFDIGYGITVGFARDLDEIMEGDQEHFVPYHTFP